MRHILIVPTILFLLSLTASIAGGQTPTASTSPGSNSGGSLSKSNWSRVQALAHDEGIVVWASHDRHVRCLFTGATEDYLFCEPRYQQQGSGEYRFDRADVDKIRLEQGARNFKIAFAGTVITGVIAGAALTNSKYGGERVVGAIGGGLAGTVAGAVIAIPVAVFVPGHLVYQRPHTSRKPHDVPPKSAPTLQPQQ